jgi:3-hydroxyisobutyrate dehydrogenase-like beta-hydroxyacid dehydrogenase
MNVGVIYLELMELQIAFRLALERYIVTVFSRVKSRVQKILASNTTNLKASSLSKELGDTCDMAIICVKYNQAVVDVSFSSGRHQNGVTNL